MKKLLLLSCLAAAAPCFAGVETATYDAYDGFTCTPLYNISRNVDQQEFLATPMAEYTNKTRSMVARDGKLYIAESRTMTVNDESNDFAHLIVIDQLTGKIEGRVQLTLNGEPISGLLCAQQIGLDDFGNIWLMPLVGSSEGSPYKIYHIKDVVSGETELVAQLTLPTSEAEAYGRHDFYDIVGDVTGKEAGTVMMSPVASGADLFVVGFSRDQGSDKWEPHMSGYYAGIMGDSYPAGQSTWNGAPMVRIVRDEDHSGSIFYIDAFVTAPALYNIDGTMLDSFAAAPEYAPKVGPNGVSEFSFGGKDFLIYTLCDYDLSPGSQIRIVEFGPDMGFEGMQLAWDVPKGGLGDVSDTGSRMMGICPVIVTDDNGKEGCYLSVYKCNNGLATYLIAEPGFEASAIDITTDKANGPVEFFDLQGRRIVNPVAGTMVIKRQGDETTKEIIR